MKEQVIGYKITVEYYCENAIESEDLSEAFNNDVGALWQFISNHGNRPPFDYADSWQIVKVESVNKCRCQLL